MLSITYCPFESLTSSLCHFMKCSKLGTWRDAPEAAFAANYVKISVFFVWINIHYTSEVVLYRHGDSVPQLLRVVGDSARPPWFDLLHCYSQQEVDISVMLRRRPQLLPETITLFVSCCKKHAASWIYVLSSDFNSRSDKGRSAASRNWGGFSEQFEEKK